MTDFVLQVVNADRPCDRGKMLDEIANYAKFLKRPLTIEMFAPCDEDGNVLEEPCSIGVGNDFYYERALDQYEQAKERVLFVFDFNNPQHLMESRHSTIEDLANFYSPILTKSAIKQIGI